MLKDKSEQRSGQRKLSIIDEEENKDTRQADSREQRNKHKSKEKVLGKQTAGVKVSKNARKKDRPLQQIRQDMRHEQEYESDDDNSVLDFHDFNISRGGVIDVQQGSFHSSDRNMPRLSMAARTDFENEESDSPLLRNQLSIPPSIPLLKQKSEMPKLNKLRDDPNSVALQHSVTPDNLIVS